MANVTSGNTLTLHETGPLVEALLHARPSLRLPLQVLGVEDVREGRVWSPKEHTELEPLVAPFVDRDMVAIAVLGSLSVVALVGLPKGKERLLPIVYIVGTQSRVERQSAGLLQKELLDYLNVKDFLPDPFCKKVVYVKQWDEMTGKCHGLCFSEVGKGLWSLDDPQKIDPESTAETTPREIISQIVSDATDSH